MFSIMLSALFGLIRLDIACLSPFRRTCHRESAHTSYPPIEVVMVRSSNSPAVHVCFVVFGNCVASSFIACVLAMELTLNRRLYHAPLRVDTFKHKTNEQHKIKSVSKTFQTHIAMLLFEDKTVLSLSCSTLRRQTV